MFQEPGMFLRFVQGVMYVVLTLVLLVIIVRR